MSHELISRSEDLKKLQDEGYDIRLADGYLVIYHIPYVDENKLVQYGIVASELDLSGDSTVKPANHVVLWMGSHPCDHEGKKLTNLVNSLTQGQISDNLVISHSFSQKPEGGYDDYYHKMTTYIRILQNEARSLEPTVTAFVKQDKIPSAAHVFNYIDTASSRVGITAISKKLKQDRIAIIGLGGTGAYVLDLVAKTPVKEIHLFDDDKFLQHNAFRSPGAPSLDDLSERPSKVERFAKVYSNMRKEIIPHAQRINESNITELNSMSAVFLCVDNDKSRQLVVNHLIENKIPLIDTGIGLYSENDALGGLVRITTLVPSLYAHAATRISCGADEDNVYSNNIQISDMNALAAALAVIRWKKMCKFYHDFGHEHNAVYQVVTNEISNDEVANEAKVD